MDNISSSEEIKNKIKLIRNTHYLILASFLASIILMIYSKELAIYGAVFIASVGLIQALNKGRCPLTVYERDARRLIGDNSDEKFIEGIFSRLFHINVHPYAIRAFSLSGMGLAGYTIVVYLLKVL